MIKQSVKRLLVGAVVLGVLGGQAASADTFFFGGPDFNWLGQGTTLPNIVWISGDNWDQTFASVLPSVDHADFHLTYDVNVLSVDMDMDAFINGNDIGSFVIHPGDAVSDLSFDFSAIAGTNYDVELMVTNTVPNGDGSASLLADGVSSSVTLSRGRVLTPEPFTMSLGLASIGLYVRRRKAAKKA